MTKNTRFFESNTFPIFNNDILDTLMAVDQRFGTSFAPVYWEPFQGNKPLTTPAPMRAMGASSSESRPYQEITNEDGKIWVHGSYPKLRITRKNNKDKKLEAIHILAAVPGVAQKGVAVFIEGAKITIETNPPEQENAYEEINILNEIPAGKNRVEIGMNGPFDVENSIACFKDNGMLEITVPTLKQKKRVNILGK